jgi:hypothetical protein
MLAGLPRCSGERFARGSGNLRPRLQGLQESRDNQAKSQRANIRLTARFRVRDLLRYNLRAVRAYLLKEAFQQLWNA